MKLRRLPITARIPLIVTLFMITVSTFASERVLSRLAETQTRQVQALADVYLDGLALALVDSIIREDVWQAFDVLDRSRQRPGGIRPAETIVAGADGLVIAASDPIAIAPQAKVPARYIESLPQDGKIAISADRQRAYVRRQVLYENLQVGSIYAALDIASLLAERREVLWTLIVTNAALTLLLAAAAWFIVGCMMRPVKVLTTYLERSHAGRVDPIPAPIVAGAGGDYKRPFAAFNKLATAVAEREALGAKLAEEERLASLGRLTSGMAHEINNPLGGLFNAIDTLKQHGADPAVRKTAIDLVERGLKGIRDVVRAALMSYRAERDDRFLKPEDMEDLKLLTSPEPRRRGVVLHWCNELSGEVPLPATAIRQITLNLVLNACQVSPRESQVAVSIRHTPEAVVLAVEDAGPGMPPPAAAKMLTEAVGLPAPIGKGTGLGLWITNRLVRELGGSVAIGSGREGGTRVTVAFPLMRKVELRNVA
ncbi:MAG: sensor histidine kinase [Hyphomicrobiaceae bacterium]